FVYALSPSDSYPLSLHDALPIFHHRLLAALDPLGDLYLALAGEEGHRPHLAEVHAHGVVRLVERPRGEVQLGPLLALRLLPELLDRKSTRLNSSHVAIPYAVFCL